MIWSDAAVRAALGLLGDAREDLRFSGISTDTRAIPPGALFVALAGDRFDAHAFLADAARAGAAGAVVRAGTPAIDGLVLYEVPDTLHALGSLGRHRRRSIHGPVVAVTGTNGRPRRRK
jgi:UDP-N-acetylmuramoyl-tripeptide--D-alanyl-D-alanine ligase